MKRKKPLRLAIIDHLTGLYNRRYFDKRLKKIIPESKKKKKHFSLLMIDIDKFKDVNDKYGHLAGDKVLNDLAKVLKKSMRKPDICFRYGGDEIAVILPGSGKKAAAKIMARLKTKIEKHRFSIEDGIKLRLRLSIGLAIFPEDGTGAKALIKKADVLLYKVKYKKRPKRTKEPFILETKLIPPVPKENTIARPRLLASLKTNKNKKLVLIIADAGYGKTTLASQFLYLEKLPCVFYGLDANDRDLSVFLLHLIEAMQKIQKSLGKRTKTLLSHLENITGNIEMIMGTLINEIAKKQREDLFIIFDDYHAISKDSLVHQALDYFIEYLPENAHILISTRISPPLSSLARWRSKQDVFELTRDELRFTDEEITLLLKDIYKTTLGSEELKGLVLHTEGWATGLQMILQHTGGEKIKNTLNGYLESNVPLFEYFANEILKKESEVVQVFLLKSSILKWMAPDICDVILNIKNSIEMLQSLKQHNLFTTLVSARPLIYKYHHLFKEFLQHKLAKTISSKESNRLHLNAARFYIKKKIWDRVIHHLIKARAYDRTAKIIEKVGKNLITTGRVDILYHWLDSLPQNVVNSQPWFFIYKADILHQWGKWDESLVFYKNAQRFFHCSGDRDGEAEILDNISLIYCRRGKYKNAITVAKKALDLIKGGNIRLKIKLLSTLARPYQYIGEYDSYEQILKEALSLCRRCNYPKITLHIKEGLALQYMNSGKLSQTLAIYHDLLKSKIFIKFLASMVIAYCNIAKIHLIQGNFEVARSFIEKAIQSSKEINYKRGQIVALYLMGDFYQVLGKHNEALNYYNQTLDLNKDTKIESTNLHVWYGMADIYLSKGELDKAEEYIKKSLTIQRTGKNRLRVAYFMFTFGGIKLRAGDYKQAEAVILQCHRIFQKTGHKIDMIFSYFRLADLYWAKGDFQKMKKYLKEAITIAKQQKYDGLLVYELNQNPQILESVKAANIESDYLSSLMKKISKGNLLAAQLFGMFQIKVNGVVVPKKRWKTEKAESIFAYLFTKGMQVVTRDKLMNIFYSDFDPEKAGNNLKNSISLIRNATGRHNVILYEAKGYRINPKVKCWTDVDEFLQIIKIGERYEKEGGKAEAATQYLKAVEIYKGDYLKNFYDNWCEEPREYYRSLYLKILKVIANYFYEQNQYEESIEYYRKIVEKDKFLEEAYCGIMRCHAKLGNRKGAIQQYQKLTVIFRKEFNCEPSPETKKLYEHLMR